MSRMSTRISTMFLFLIFYQFIKSFLMTRINKERGLFNLNFFAGLAALWLLQLKICYLRNSPPNWHNSNSNINFYFPHCDKRAGAQTRRAVNMFEKCRRKSLTTGMRSAGNNTFQRLILQIWFICFQSRIFSISINYKSTLSFML